MGITEKLLKLIKKNLNSHQIISFFTKQIEKITLFNSASFFFIFMWLLLLISSFFMENGQAKIGVLAAKIEFFVHFLAIYLLLKMCKKTQEKSRNNMLWLLAVNIVLLIIDFCYYIGAYAEYQLSTSVEFLLYNFPPMLGCLFIIIFIIKILLNGFLPYKKFIKLSVVFILTDIIIMLLFFSSLKSLEIITWREVSQIITLSEQIIQYNFAMVGLIYAIDISAVFLLIGLVTLLASAYSYISNILYLFPYAEMLWFLGLLFILLSVINIYKSKNYQFSNWFRKENTIKGQLAFWAFSISMGGFLLFFCIAYSFSIVDKAVFVGLPLFIMMYSIIAIILSIIMGRNFEIPFRKIEKNIALLKQSDNKLSINNDFSIAEFIYLQEFIVDAFEYKEEQDRTKKHIGEITAQVAHDIRSPLAAIDTVIDLSKNGVITENEKIMIRTAFRRINNITNDLVAKYKGKNYEPDTFVFLYVVIKDIISEKDWEYCRYNIDFKVELDNQESAFLLTEGSYKEINRIFSNLINNSVDAMDNGGLIKVFCERNFNNIIVRIIDQGRGIPDKKIEQLISSDEKNLIIGKEIGFGLKHAKNYLKKHGGDIKITSKENVGTQLTLLFPISKKPKWLAEKIEIDFKYPVIIIDDDESIHNIWTKKFEGLNLIREDFYTLEQAKKYLQKESIQYGIILCDYEFLGCNETGLSFLESIRNLNINKYLVTTHVDNFDIVERCEENNFQLIPKHLLAYVMISEKVDLLPIYLENQVFPDAILIDDEVYNHDFWKYKAKKKNKILHCYLSLEDFIANKDNVFKNTPIYIDLNLNQVSGIDVAKNLHQKGFLKLYITTGFIDFDVNRYPYITDVIGKSPPF